MPNWCVNQLHLEGPDTDEILDFITDPKPLLHRQATRAAVKLFLAGVGGLLKPTHSVSFPLYPELTQEVGRLNDANQAFTRFVTLLNEEVTLTKEVCLALIELLEQSGLKQRYWGDLPVAARKKMAPLLRNSMYDWSGLYFRRLALDVVWAKLDVPESALQEGQFSLNSLLPPRLLVELNGFNGRLFPSVDSGFNDNCDRLGTKWEIVTVEVLDESSNFAKLEFDTAWSPALPPIAELARRYPKTTITHYFAECGYAFGGYRSYVDGEEDTECWDELVFSETENDEGYQDLIGPDYIVANFERYGG